MYEHTCRICLKNNNCLNSVFEYDQYLTYSEMIFSLTNIQILKSETQRDLICLECQRKLRDSYDFKVLIQRSNLIINNYNVNRFQFDNIEEVKNSFPSSKQCSYSPKFHLDHLMKNLNTVKYHETDITKIKFSQENTSQNEIGDNSYDLLYCNNSDGSYSEEYSQPLSKRKSKVKRLKVKKSEKLNRGQSQFPSVTNVCIMPKISSKTVRIKFLRKKSSKTPRKVDPLICPHCGKLTKYLDKHIITHTGEKKYNCENEMCLKSFYTQSQLKRHMKIHSNWKTFKCDECSAIFALQASLNSHRSIHDECRSVVCDICNKSFKRRSTMLTHKLQHTLPMCKCDECGMAFYTRDKLRNHKRVHTGERPFKCEICSQPYSYKHDFNNHCFKKHGVFLKRRQVYVMNEEVLLRERSVMRELSLQVKNGYNIKEIKNPFEGPHAGMALQIAIKMLKENRITDSIVQ